MDAKISRNFWSDPVIENLSVEQKLAFLWLVSNERTNLLGFVEVTQRRFEFETGCPYDALLSLCQDLSKGIVKCGNGFWIRKYIARQIGTKKSLLRNTFCRSLVKELRACHGQEIFSHVVGEYPELLEALGEQESKPITSPLNGHAMPERREEKRREEKSTVSAEAGDVPSDAFPHLAKTTGFAEFWAAYPKRRNQPGAMQAWLSTAETRPPLPDLLAALERHKASAEWTEAGGRYVPMASRWLEDQRWADDLGPATEGASVTKAIVLPPEPPDWREAAQQIGYDLREDASWDKCPPEVRNEILRNCQQNQSQPTLESPALP